MTDYSLWEVILNGDSPIPTRVIDGVVQPVAPTTAEQRLAKKNELKACEAIEKQFGGNKETTKVQKTPLKQQYKNFTGSSFESLDQIHDRLQKLISQLEILVESLTNEPVSAVTSVSTASEKIPVSALPNVDTLSNASMNYQPVTAGNQSNPNAGVQEQFDAEKAREDNVQQYVLFPLWSSGFNDPQNTDGDATFEVKEPEFKVEKPESEVHISPSSSAKTKKHDDKTKRKAKGKSLVELST
nr:hypothetical protein [Tanacetum cinerariifolium]